LYHPTIKRSTVDGFDAVHVDTGALALTLLPELGGKIGSLRDMRSGREWLWRNPRIGYRRLPHGSSYVAEADTGGWDECFPTVAACAYPSPPWAGASIQDHGELWSQQATVDVIEDADGVALHTRWRGVALPYTFDRTARLAAGSARLRVEYAVSSDADAPIRFIWSAHPLLVIEPGMRLLVPASARFNCWLSIPTGLLAEQGGIAFPLAVRAGARKLDLASLPDASAGVALKLWSDPLAEGWATLRASDGELRMRWDAALLPQLAFWMNLGGGAADGGEPYYNLGLEPCIGAQDSLAQAVEEAHLFETLPPRESRAWSLDVELAL
jgi:galactose mutarotase-like enzyme